MRPRELTLRGFRSYADETTFDFGDRSLVGIVGPIGSGKSSILDAISFALFGRTPRISDTKSLINQRRDTLAVSLTFEVDGTAWRVVRSLRRNGAAAHTLYRQEGDDFSEVADKAREVTAEIGTLLGLDFDAFRRSVLLAQNQFAEFLEATPTERNKVLKGVFGFDRLDGMREVVKARLDRLGGRLQALTERRASAENDRAVLEIRRKEMVVAEERASALAGLRVSVSQASDALREAEGRVKAATAEVAGLDDLARAVPSREATEGLFAEATAATAALVAADAEARAADAAAAEATAAREAALAAVGGREALDRAADAVAAYAVAITERERAGVRLDQARAAGEEAQGEAAAAADGVAQAEALAADAAEALATAEAAETAARIALHEAHQADRAALLRSDLVVGDACPVCDRIVDALPTAIAAPGVDAAQKLLTEASAAVAAARQAEAAARAGVVAARAAVGAAERRVAEVAEALTAAGEVSDLAATTLEARRVEAEALLGPGEPADRLAEVRAAVAAAEAAEHGARRIAEERRGALGEARRRSEAAVAALSGLQREMAALGGRLGVEVTTGDDAAAVEAALKDLRQEWIRRRQAADETREQAERAAAAAVAARADLLTGAGLEASDDIVEVATEAAREATRIGAEVGLIEKRLTELDTLAAEEQELVVQSALLERLHTDLRPSGFLEFVLDERRRTLADLAGVHFETLTAGRYRFGDDADFNVVDRNAADMVRAPASLSGGETFLASLALALALAEIVAREGGRLDAFFLDEGFGSLDPEHLDLAMDGIERLVAANPDRVVVVVSHVPEMRERMEDLIVLDRDGLGSTRVVSGAGAPP